ncbi:MAG: 4-oxalomesaconate tautomerase [Pseudomonadota bacterium]
MPQTGIPFLFMRGGTSRGPYFKRSDLPKDEDDLTAVLISALGAGHDQNIDGIGGGVAVTTKVAMLSRSDHDWADIDYFFAQVAVDRHEVDYNPTCGNILSGVGPAALEMGLIEPTGEETTVRVRAVNTDALIEAIVKTPDGTVQYDGGARIDGVPGTAAPIRLSFMDVVGSATGALFPTGHSREEIDGIEVSCTDVAMPVVIARAADFGLSGRESAADLDANSDFYARMEPVRIEAGRRMGMGDVTKSVVPKFAVLAVPEAEGTVTARYFMPRKCHPSMAVTGAQCIAACSLAPDTVASTLGLSRPDEGKPVIIEHPSGQIEVLADYQITNTGLDLRSAGLLRTARKLAEGTIFVPGNVWSGHNS